MRDVIAEERAALAAACLVGLEGRGEHELVHEQLFALGEEVGEGDGLVVRGGKFELGWVGD